MVQHSLTKTILHQSIRMALKLEEVIPSRRCTTIPIYRSEDYLGQSGLFDPGSTQHSWAWETNIRTPRYRCEQCIHHDVRPIKKAAPNRSRLCSVQAFITVWRIRGASISYPYDRQHSSSIRVHSNSLSRNRGTIPSMPACLRRSVHWVWWWYSLVSKARVVSRNYSDFVRIWFANDVDHRSLSAHTPPRSFLSLHPTRTDTKYRFLEGHWYSYNDWIGCTTPALSVVVVVVVRRYCCCCCHQFIVASSPAADFVHCRLEYKVAHVCWYLEWLYPVKGWKMQCVRTSSATTTTPLPTTNHSHLPKGTSICKLDPKNSEWPKLVTALWDGDCTKLEMEVCSRASYRIHCLQWFESRRSTQHHPIDPLQTFQY